MTDETQPGTELEPQRPTLPVVGVREGMFGVHGSGDTSGYGGLVLPVVMPGPSERPYGSYFDEVVDALFEAYPQAGEAVRKVVVVPGRLINFVAN